MWNAKGHQCSPLEPLNRPLVRRFCAVVLALLLTLAVNQAGDIASALRADSAFSPVSGHAQVIAQGVVELPRGQAVWRTTRARAPLPVEATFDAKPLGFVFASSGPMLLVDGVTGEQTQLGIGEGALVRAGAVQQRVSLAEQPVNYLTIELVPADASLSTGVTVLETGEPFPAPTGLHDLDLLADTLASSESLTIPDSGAENLVLVTAGAALVASPDGENEVLLAGESAGFNGERRISPAPDSDAPVSILAAIIGPELPAAAIPNRSATPSPGLTATAVVPSDVAARGSITIQVYSCPSGMTADSIDIAACAPIKEGFDISILAPGLAQPLTLSDATPIGGGFTWKNLPLGDYQIIETALPPGATTYILAARGAAGDPTSGYRVSIDAEQPELPARVYNFRP
jgi:hypothetical protein